ncbi:MAG: LacI family DNA-binding transcriptional regulator [Devosia sp.]|uniref:LacI family DNA-binding transcriptional regulator n=1 Tax=Devosia sp. TaxID=1871048 RepID=UPI0024CC5FE2|nr:LacI family DNA-binding transcriptional regulator [Devosia sp.]UYN99287.1 MAG: LacI family DNA-binding transcriptional regulator [Devosia sp.]
MATITDVSKRAGVSRSTVSRVVAGNGYVSEANRKAIEAAIAELGYRPNTLAQALRSNRSNVIGAVFVDVGTPYFANMTYGVQRAIRPAGKSLMVSSGFADQDEEARAIIELIDRSCDGLILYLEHPMRNDVAEMLRRADVPVVSIGHKPSPVSRGQVMLDNYGGARAAMRHLLERDHRQIVYLSGQAEFGDTIARRDGMIAALAEYGMDMSDIHVVAGEFHQRFGYAATLELLDEDRAFTAICAGDDDIAGGVLLALRERGVRVPDDISVIGFDDAFHAQHMWPPLTTVRQCMDALGEAAGNLLLTLLAEPETDRLKTVVNTELVVRSSVAAPAMHREGA